MGRLDGKVALITGAARGQGAAEAALFSSEGARGVVVADLLTEEAHAVAAGIGAAGGHALSVRLDVTRAQDWAEAIDAARARFGRLDVLINNAAIWMGEGPVDEVSEEVWDRMFAVNTKGAFLGTKAALPAMRASGGGSIVNIASTSGLHGSAQSTAYAASKAALVNLTRSTARQYAAEGIRANVIHPGPENPRPSANDQPPENPRPRPAMTSRLIVERDVMVTMRDGVRLATDVYRPDEGGPQAVVYRLHSGDGVTARRHRLEDLLLVAEGIGQRHLEGLAQYSLERGQCGRGARRQFGGPFDGPVNSLAVGHDSIDAAQGVQAGGADRPPVEDDLGRHPRADQTGQAAGPADAGGDTQLHLGLGEPRPGPATRRSQAQPNSQPPPDV